MRRALAVVAALLVTAGILAACRPPTDLTVTAAVTGLNRPWDLAFAPDGRMFITERPGTIKVWDGSTTTSIHTVSGVVAVGEGGLLGLAVDPDYATNRYLYACFNTSTDVRVARWTVNSTSTALTNRTDIVTGMPVRSTGRHSGCRPRFGPDGYLWIGTGDTAIGTIPQNPASLGGKVLRVDRNGNAAPGNPGVVNPSSPLDDRIYTYGHRNVQGLAFRPSDGAAFSIEHGTGCDDEVNRLVAGGNYGWDPVVPGNPSGYDESQPMTDLAKFPTARVAVWSSGCPTVAPSGGTFLTGNQWVGFNDGLAMAVLKGQRLQVLRFDPANNDAILWNWTDITDQGRLRSAVQGPDGNLYLATDANPGRILKVVPTP